MLFMINQYKGQSQIKPKPLKIEKEQNDPKIIGNCLNYTCYKQVLTHTNMCLYACALLTFIIKIMPHVK